MLTVGILIFPGVEELDFIGPFEVFSSANKIQVAAAKVVLISETTEVIRAFNGLQIIPDATIFDCPKLDVLILPGGKGRLIATKNPALLKFVNQQAREVKFLSTVCTGAFFLAEAGLLDGKRATTHRNAFEELAALGVRVTKEKVVRDGKIFTAAGISSGIELGLILLAEIFGVNFAQKVADRIEYDIDVAKLYVTV